MAVVHAEVHIAHGGEKYRAILWKYGMGGIIQHRPKRVIDGETYPADEVMIFMNANAKQVVDDLKAMGVDVTGIQPLADAIMA